MIIGVFLDERIRRHTSIPFKPGSIKSNKIRSMSSFNAFAKPSLPSKATKTSYFSYSSSNRIKSDKFTSSSIIRIFFIIILLNHFRKGIAKYCYYSDHLRMRITLGHPLHHRFLLLQSYLLFLTRYILTIRGLIFVLPRISTDIESLEYTAFSWSLLA